MLLTNRGTSHIKAGYSVYLAILRPYIEARRGDLGTTVRLRDGGDELFGFIGLVGNLFHIRRCRLCYVSRNTKQNPAASQ